MDHRLQAAALVGELVVGEKHPQVHLVGREHAFDALQQLGVGVGILALAGVDVGEAMIGENLLDVVEKRTDNRPNQVFAQISESRVGRCVRTPDYLYSVYAPGVNGGEAAASDTYADDFLYDLKADPWQLNNVVADPAYAQAKADMRRRLLDWLEKAEGYRPTITD